MSADRCPGCPAHAGRRRRAGPSIAGAVTVLAAGGGVWRAHDRGVWSVADGAAFEPWSNWRTEAADGALALARAGILASNPHNTQPWRFRVTGSQVELLADTSRHLGTFDPYRREMYLGLGCALENMMLGALARTTLTGSQPSRGGYDEGYFFNTVTTGIAAKYYPLARAAVFLRGEAGIGAVLTKNRFLDDAGEQSYFYQFGIGPSGAIGIGYSLTPFRNRAAALDLQLLYQQMRTRVEVDGLGDDHWSSGALHLVVGAAF